jgi:hypothetical protein
MKNNECESCNGSGIRRDVIVDCQTIKGKEIIERCDTCEKYESDLEAANLIAEFEGKTVYPNEKLPFGNWSVVAIST